MQNVVKWNSTGGIHDMETYWVLFGIQSHAVDFSLRHFLRFRDIVERFVELSRWVTTVQVQGRIHLLTWTVMRRYATERHPGD